MKNQIVLWAAQMTADPRRRRIFLFGLAVLALVGGIAGVAEAGPATGGPMPGP
jgi:hypothetical protein